MVFHESILPYLGYLIGLATLTVAILGYIVTRTRFFRGKYETHIKNLVNSIYNKVTDNGRNLAEPNFFGTIAESKEMLEHLFTQQKQSNLYDIFSEIVEARKTRGTRDRISELRKQLSEEFIKLYEKINQKIDPNFGYCRECVNIKTKIPFWNKYKLKKIKT